MSKKFCFVCILVFAILFSFVGCTDLVSPKTQTDINLNIDLSKIYKSVRNEGDVQHSQTVEITPILNVAIYNAKNYNATTNSPENLILITQVQSNISADGIASVKLSAIPIGIDAIVFTDLSFYDGTSSQVVYAGNSDVFTVKASGNKVSLVLKKIDDEPSVDDPADELSYEEYTLHKRDDEGNEKEIGNSDSMNSSTTDVTTITLNDYEKSTSVWTYYVQLINNNRFSEDANYKVSVELKTSADDTAVVGIAAARADYFFTINDKWTTCEFETGYVKGSDSNGFTIGVGLSSETQIRNLKIEKLEEETNLPSLVFDISKTAIQSYLDDTNRAPQIVEVTKNDEASGYNIKINAPLSHTENSDDGTQKIIQDVKFHLRSYATENTGANTVSFDIENIGNTDFETSFNADTASENSISWNNNPTSFARSSTDKASIDFPNYVTNDELTVDIITNSLAVVESANFTISNFGVTESNEPFADKIFVYKTKTDNDNNGYVFTKIENLGDTSISLSIPKSNSKAFDVLMFNNDDWNTESNSPEDDCWNEATRFTLIDNSIENLAYFYDYSGGESYIVNGTSDNDITVKITLGSDYKLKIEKNDSSTSGGGNL